MEVVQKDGTPGTGIFSLQGHGDVIVDMDGHIEAEKTEPTKKQLSAAQRNMSKGNILGGLIWIPFLKEVQIPDADEVEEVFLQETRKEKRC